MRTRTATMYLLLLVGGSFLVALHAILAFSGGMETSFPMILAWPVAFPLVLTCWLVEDSKSFPGIYKPFDFGFLAYLLCLFYLPYYLWRTRRFLGMLLLVGFLVLYWLNSWGLSCASF